jgi:Domain of unknown function (DUF4345)
MDDAPPPAVRVFLAVSTAVWLPYGLFCLFQPDFLGEAAGVGALTPTGRTELRAMYGGLQAGLGLLTLRGCQRRGAAATALTTLAVVCGGLFSARLVGTVLDGAVSSYTGFALLFESLSTAGAVALHRRVGRRAP